MDRVYFNDEWNEPKSTYDSKVKKHQEFKRESNKDFKKKVNERTNI